MKPLPAFAATAALALATGDMAHAIETIEAVGAERCGGSVKALEVEFLAPDNASLAGTAKAIVNGIAAILPNAARLSIDVHKRPLSPRSQEGPDLQVRSFLGAAPD